MSTTNPAPTLHGTGATDAAPYDALLVLSFGGPEKQDDVLPFLENVTRGRNIPRERLAEVGEHYTAFGGRSPINDQNRTLVAALEHELAEREVSLPVYWGNRNWDPYLADELRQMRVDGIERAAVFVTSAYSSYSGCRQYREDLAAAVAEVGADAPRLDRLRQYFDHPGFVQANVDGVVGALGELPEDVRAAARIVFVTHSIPTSMAETAGPTGGAYVDQHLAAAGWIAEAVADRTGLARAHDLVYCSRSGPPSMPWLEPDVNDHIRALHEQGVPAVVLAPIGFVSDHMEVVFDLDTEAAETAAELGLPMARAATAGVHPAFVGAVVDLLLERAGAERGERVPPASLGAPGPWPAVCAVGCCAAGRGEPRPALCGADAPRYEDLAAGATP